MAPQRKAQPPTFACTTYPGCPEREECRSSVREDADPEECIGAITSHYFETVTGPCKDGCYLKKMATPVSHAIPAIMNGRLVDIGS